MRPIIRALLLSFAAGSAFAGGGPAENCPPAPTATPEVMYAYALHEAGHVLIALEMDCIHPYAVSISETGGMTRSWFNPNDDKCMENMMVVDAAGLAAEKLILRQTIDSFDADLRQAVARAQDLSVPGCLVSPSTVDDQCMSERINERVNSAMDQAYYILSLREDELRQIADEIFMAGTLELGNAPPADYGCH